MGVGVHAGQAYVGRVGAGAVRDFTALGDTINLASRLQAEAKAGQIVMSEPIYQEVADLYSQLEQQSITVRGRNEPVIIRVLSIDSE